MAALGDTLASLLALVWLGITIRAMFADRARGRRRCPRCFYDIDPALGLRCAECGHAARSERDLARTRRHWRTVVLACVLLLLPAFAAGLASRIAQYGGWPAVPTPVATRLLWIGNEGLREDLIRRIHGCEIQHADAERIVVHASRRLSRGPRDCGAAFDLLRALSGNSFGRSRDRPGTVRPMLEELRPDLTVPPLIEIAQGPDPIAAVVAIDLLSHLRDVDERAMMTMFCSMSSSDASIADAAMRAIMEQWPASASVRRLPPWPAISLNQQVRERLTAFSQLVVEMRDDEASLVDWLGHTARRQATASDPVVTWHPIWRGTALWLYCRLTEFSTEAWGAVEIALKDHEIPIRQTAIQQIAGFEWNEHIERALVQALSDPYLPNHHDAVDVAATFGRSAKPLVPEFLASVRDPRRNFHNPYFLAAYRAIGGEDGELLGAIIDRLQVDNHIPAYSLGLYEPVLRRLAEDSDPSVAAAANEVLSKLKP